MRTIQEYLKEADIDRLVKEYLTTYPIKYGSENKMDMNVRQIRAIMENRLVKYIHRLESMKIVPDQDNEESILFAYKYLRDGFEDIAYSLVHKQELLKKGPEADTYAYEYCRQSEIMGYLVSEADFTQKNIYGLMVDVLFEASFFGYEEEHLEQARKELEKASAELKRGKGILTTTEELFGEDEEETDELEEQLYHEYTDALINYENYCKKKEMEILRQLLLGKDKDSLTDFVYYDDVKFTRLEQQYKDTFLPTFDDEAGMWVVDTEHGVEFGSVAYVVGEFCGDNAVYLFNNANMPDPQMPNHGHEFESVISSLIRNPEEFSVENFEECYATQELRILHNLQEALLTVKERNYPLSRTEIKSNMERCDKRVNYTNVNSGDAKLKERLESFYGKSIDEIYVDNEEKERKNP
jgi:hypothetical protein